MSALRLDGLGPRRLRWLWREHVPAGMISALVGRPGQGKSLLALHVAAELSREASVLVSTSEDPLGEVAVPRGLAAVAACGGDPGRVYFERGRLPALPAGLGRWARRIAELELKLIVVDPIASHLTPHLGDDQGVRRALDPLARLCGESGCAVLALSHAIKSPPRQAGPLALVGGAAGGLAGQARVVLLFGRPPGGGGGRLLVQAKCNLAAARPSLRFELEVRDVGGGIEAPLLRFGGASELDAGALLDAARGQRDQPTQQAEAAAWLVSYLFAAGPPYERPQREIEDDAKQHGFAALTLRRAADTLSIAKPQWRQRKLETAERDRRAEATRAGPLSAPRSSPWRSIACLEAAAPGRAGAATGRCWRSWWRLRLAAVSGGAAGAGRSAAGGGVGGVDGAQRVAVAGDLPARAGARSWSPDSSLVSHAGADWPASPAGAAPRRRCGGCGRNLQGRQLVAALARGSVGARLGGRKRFRSVRC